MHVEVPHAVEFSLCLSLFSSFLFFSIMFADLLVGWLSELRIFFFFFLITLFHWCVTLAIP